MLQRGWVVNWIFVTRISVIRLLRVILGIRALTSLSLINLFVGINEHCLDLTNVRLVVKNIRYSFLLLQILNGLIWCCIIDSINICCLGWDIFVWLNRQNKAISICILSVWRSDRISLRIISIFNRWVNWQVGIGSKFILWILIGLFIISYTLIPAATFLF